MSRDAKSRSKNVPAITPAEVRRCAGDIDDEVVAEIQRLQPSLVDLETAVAFLRGQGDLVDRSGHPLVGKAAQLYEILSSVEDLQEERR
jgi:hypothetical protein